MEIFRTGELFKIILSNVAPLQCWECADISEQVGPLVSHANIEGAAICNIEMTQPMPSLGSV